MNAAARSSITAASGPAPSNASGRGRRSEQSIEEPEHGPRRLEAPDRHGIDTSSATASRGRQRLDHRCELRPLRGDKRVRVDTHGVAEDELEEELTPNIAEMGDRLLEPGAEEGAPAARRPQDRAGSARLARLLADRFDQLPLAELFERSVGERAAQ
jgi:hypothetical protein